MQNSAIRRRLLVQYPEGIPGPETWVLNTQPVPEPGSGQILVRALWLSVDPYMRGRRSPATNYTKGAGLGEVMHGGRLAPPRDQLLDFRSRICRMDNVIQQTRRGRAPNRR